MSVNSAGPMLLLMHSVYNVGGQGQKWGIVEKRRKCSGEYAWCDVRGSFPLGCEADSELLVCVERQ
jgi:hypothetical protein